MTVSVFNLKIQNITLKINLRSTLVIMEMKLCSYKRRTAMSDRRRFENALLVALKKGKGHDPRKAGKL